MSVGSSTSACRIKRRARTTLRSCFAVATTKDIPDNLRGNSRLRRHTRGRAKIPPRKCPSQRDTDVGKKSSPGKDRKKRRRLDERFLFSLCRLALFGDCVPYEARATKHSTADVAYETATGRAASCVSRNRRTQVSRLASRDSLLFAKSKKKALSSTSARAICARRHTARHARPAETHESTRPRAHVRPASRQRLAQAGPRPAGELRETRSSDEPTRACGYFFEP